MPQLLDDLDDPRLADYVALTDVALRRRREPEGGLYIAESEKVIRRALAVGHRPRSFLMAPRWLEDLADVVTAAEADGIPVFVGDHATIEGLTGFHLHRGALAAMHRPPLPSVAEVVDGRRFRMTFTVSGADEHAEDAWLGRRVRIGDAVVAPQGNIGRCAITTQDPDTGVPTLDTLKTIARYRGELVTTEPPPFGVHARVLVPGRVSVGDEVALED